MNISLDLDGVICQWKDLEDRTLENYDQLPPILGAHEGILDLHLMLGYVSIVTARHYRGAFNHVLDWFDKNKLPAFNELIAGIPTSEKWRVMQALNADIHVDDNIRAFEKVPPYITCILFRGDHNKDQDWSITVSSWPELVEKIKEIENGR